MSIDFETLRPQLGELCLKYGIAELSIFGSAARGDDRSDSDVDFLYVRGPDSVLGMALFGLREELDFRTFRLVGLEPRPSPAARGVGAKTCFACG